MENSKKESIAEKPTLKSGLQTEAIKDDDYTLTVVKDYDGKVDPFFLEKKNPEYAYRFIRDDAKNIKMKTSNMLFQKGGWQIVPRNHIINDLERPETEISPDGLYRRGDQILVFMPMKLFLEKEAQKQKRAKAPIDAVQRMLDKGDPNDPALKGLGHEKQVGLQTQKQLGM